jgi:hypothetical protein
MHFEIFTFRWPATTSTRKTEPVGNSQLTLHLSTSCTGDSNKRKHTQATVTKREWFSVPPPRFCLAFASAALSPGFLVSFLRVASPLSHFHMNEQQRHIRDLVRVSLWCLSLSVCVSLFLFCETCMRSLWRQMMLLMCLCAFPIEAAFSWSSLSFSCSSKLSRVSDLSHSHFRFWLAVSCCSVLRGGT